MSSPDTPEPDRGLLAEIEPGMAVVDANGERIGEVYDVFHTADSDQRERMAAILAQRPALHPKQRTELLDNGFIYIDASGIEAADRYALPDQIQSVVDRTVLLRVSGGQLHIA